MIPTPRFNDGVMWGLTWLLTYWSPLISFQAIGLRLHALRRIPRFIPNHTPSAINHTLDEKSRHSEFPDISGASGSGGHRRRGAPPRLDQEGKRKLTESAREFPKAFRLSGPEEKTVSDTPFPLNPDDPPLGSNSPLCSELQAIRSPAGCSKWHPSKAAGSSATEAYPCGTLQGDGRLRTTLGVIFSILLAGGQVGA
jgi:hypothetical protein